MRIGSWIKNVGTFYSDGFKNMTQSSKTLWIIVLIKLFIMFAILRVFFFPKFLGKFKSEKEKSDYVGEELIKKRISNINKSNTFLWNY